MTAGHDRPEPKDPAERRGFSVLGLGEIAIRCRDLEAMTAFYRDVVGLEPLAARNRIVFFRLANGVAGHTAVLALFDRSLDPRRPDPEMPASTLHHFALTVTPEGQAAARTWLEASGIACDFQDFPWIGWRGLFFRDPEGNLVELVAAVSRAAGVEDGASGA